MILTRKYPLLGSSSNPNEVSMTIKGLGVALVPMFIIVLKVFGVEVEESIILQLIDAIASLAAAIMIVYGLGRKIYFAIKNR